MKLILRETKRVEVDPRSGMSYWQYVDVIIQFYDGNEHKVADFRLDDHSWRSFRAARPDIELQ